MTDTSRPFLRLSEAKTILICQQNRSEAIALAALALDEFQTLDMIESQSVRDAVIRLGICEVLRDLKARSPSGIEWTRTREIFCDSALGSIMMADGIAFLDELIAHGHPILIIKSIIHDWSIKRNNITLFSWICDTMINRGGARSVLGWLINFTTDCDPDLSQDTASLWTRHISLLSDKIYAHTLTQAEPGGRKIAAVMVLAGIPPEIALRVLSDETLPGDLRSIMQMGTSNHARLSASLLEPSLRDVIARPADRKFLSL